MTIEHSHGKARPTLPRGGDLQQLPASATDRERSRSRQPDGRFAHGNDAARGRGWKRAISRMLGRAVEGLDEHAQLVADDSWRTFCATMRELPVDGPTVRGLAALGARHAALAAFWHARAASVGLATDEGIQAQEMAMKHGQRVERLTVSMLDAARVLGKSRSARGDVVPPGFELVDGTDAPADEAR